MGNFNIKIKGSDINKALVLKFLIENASQYQYEIIEEELTDWKDVISKDIMEDAGGRLRNFREDNNFTQIQLSEKTGIPQPHISAMEKNKRPIGKETAKKFSKIFNIDYRVFLSINNQE
jgi:ribosome-binding protein aMBF1 (putative translation factor)